MIISMISLINMMSMMSMMNDEYVERTYSGGENFSL